VGEVDRTDDLFGGQADFERGVAFRVERLDILRRLSQADIQGLMVLAYPLQSYQLLGTTS
jgi:hypothetical protein